DTLPRLKENIEYWNAIDPSDPDLPELMRMQREMFFPSIDALRQVKENNPGLKKDLLVRRQEIREYLNGKAALIGWTAVGSIADVIPTSLHSQCPGVVAHGVIFNAIMTRDFWRRPPAWVTPVITALMGLLVTAIVSIL